MKTIVDLVLRLLTFRLTREEMQGFKRSHLLFGLVGTWLVGMGRYWDDPGAHLLQHLGLGSVIYVFSLSLLLWIVMAPFRIEQWSYFRVLTFVSLTSFPALLYAIPVERWFSMEVATSINVWFLAVVAAWRFALLMWFLARYTQLGSGYAVVGGLLPVCGIIMSLAALNLERAVFQVMAGLGENAPEPTANDGAYLVVMLLTVLSYLCAIPLLIGYLILIRVRWQKKRSNRAVAKA